jgi:hypothetical protein
MKPSCLIRVGKSKAYKAVARDFSLYIWYQTENNESLPNYTNTPPSKIVGARLIVPGHASVWICKASLHIGPNIIDMHACMV